MLAETLISEYEKNIEEQKALTVKQEEILNKLKTCTEEEWDWVSVKKASSHFDMSINMIYQKINSGAIHSKRFNNKILVSMKELNQINDAG